jgi:hypothetical protein
VGVPAIINESRILMWESALCIQAAIKYLFKTLMHVKQLNNYGQQAESSVFWYSAIMVRFILSKYKLRLKPIVPV